MHNIVNFQRFALPAVAQSVNYWEEGSETHCIESLKFTTYQYGFIKAMWFYMNTNLVFLTF